MVSDAKESSGMETGTGKFAINSGMLWANITISWTLDKLYSGVSPASEGSDGKHRCRVSSSVCVALVLVEVSASGMLWTNVTIPWTLDKLYSGVSAVSEGSDGNKHL